MRYLSGIILLALSALGCAPTLADARVVVNAAQTLYEQTKSPLERRYEEDQLACLNDRPPPPEPCVTSIRKAWRPIKDAETAFYRAVLLAQSVVGTAEAGAVLGRKPSVLQVMTVVSSAVDAGEKLRDAIQALDHPDPAPAPPPPPSSPFAPWPNPATAPKKPTGGAS